MVKFCRKTFIYNTEAEKLLLEETFKVMRINVRKSCFKDIC